MTELLSSVTENLFTAQAFFGFAAALGTFLTVLLLGGPIVERGRLKSRMKAVAVERDRIRDKERAKLTAEGKAKSLREAETSQQAFMKKIVKLLNLREALDDGSLADRLAQAGYRGPRPITVFLFARFVLPLIMFVAAIGLVFGLGLLPDFEPLMRGLICFGAAACAFYIPGIIVNSRTAKRQDSVRLAFPDALDLLLICVESGMSIEAALQRVSDEIGSQSSALAEELVLTKAELSFLQQRTKAYENLAKRTGLDGVKACSLALIQAEKFGTPLGDALRTMAQENRDNRLLAAEEKAASLPPKLTVPMIVFFLPVLFIIILTPAIIQIFDIIGE